MRRGGSLHLAGLAAALGLAAAGAAKPADPPPAGRPSAPPRVRVDSGVLAGVAQGSVLVFKGVPYAAPPLGPLRWRPPQPPLPWAGERSATAAGPACLQKVDASGSADGGGVSGGVSAIVSEDCLTLQVFAPQGARKAPVMVWLHGGGHLTGTGSKPVYDGAAFVRDGVVLVAIDSRLGVLGFFAHPALTRDAPAGEPLVNYGLLDEMAALRWVQRNIAAFGGDPANVTLFGESSGGQDVFALLAAPAARGLFARAIAESPGHGWEPLPSLAAGEGEGERAASQAGLAGPGVTAAQLRALPAERLVRELKGDYQPTVDGRLLRESPTEAFARGHAADVPLLLGSNSYEASLAPGAGVPPGVTAEIRAAYAADATTHAALGAALFADRFFNAPVRWFARHAASGAPAWLYHFSYVRVSQRGKVPGAPHGSEIPYVFDSWDAISSRAALLPAEDRAMTARVHSCWVSFARTGVPVWPGGPVWPAYTPERDELLEIAAVPVVRQHFRQAQLDAQEHAAAFLPSAKGK